jgi:hypothetical protein
MLLLLLLLHLFIFNMLNYFLFFFFNIIISFNLNCSTDLFPSKDAATIIREKNALNKFLVNYSTELITVSACIVCVCYLIQTIHKLFFKENNHTQKDLQVFHDVQNDFKNVIKLFSEVITKIKGNNDNAIININNDIKELLASLKDIVDKNNNDFSSIAGSLELLKDFKEGDDDTLKNLVKNINDLVLSLNKSYEKPLQFNNNPPGNHIVEMPKEFSELMSLVKSLLEKLTDESKNKINNQNSLEELFKSLLGNIEQLFNKTIDLIEKNNNNRQIVLNKKEESVNKNKSQSESKAFENLYDSFKKQIKCNNVNERAEGSEEKEEEGEKESQKTEYDKFVLYVDQSIIDSDLRGDKQENNNKKIFDFVMQLKIEEFFIYIKNYCDIGWAYDDFVNNNIEKSKIEELFLYYKKYLLKKLPQEKSIKKELSSMTDRLGFISKEIINYISKRDDKENNQMQEREKHEKESIQNILTNIECLNTKYCEILKSPNNQREISSESFEDSILLEEFFMFWCDNFESANQISSFLEFFLRYFGEDFSKISYDFCQKNNDLEVQSLLASLSNLLFAFNKEKEKRKQDTERSKEFFEYKKYFIDSFKKELSDIISIFQQHKTLIIETYDFTASAEENNKVSQDQKKYKKFSDPFLEYSNLLKLGLDQNSFFANILKKYILQSKTKIKEDIESKKEELALKIEELNLDISEYKKKLSEKNEELGKVESDINLIQLYIKSRENNYIKEILENEIRLLEKLILKIDNDQIFITEVFAKFNKTTNETMNNVICCFKEYLMAHAERENKRLYIEKLQKIFIDGSKVKIPNGYVDLPQMEEFRDMKAAAMIINRGSGVGLEESVLNDYTVLPHMVLHGLPGTGKTLAIQKEVALLSENNNVFYMQFDRERDSITDLLKLVKDYIDLIIKPKIQKDMRKDFDEEEAWFIAEKKKILADNNNDLDYKNELEDLKKKHNIKIEGIKPDAVFIIQIDEVNSLAKDIGIYSEGSTLESTNKLLTQIDAINEFNKSKGLYQKCFIQLCGTTNHLDSMEDAAIREGRLMPVEINPPSKADRAKYFDQYFSEVEILWRNAIKESTTLLWKSHIELVSQKQTLFECKTINHNFSEKAVKILERGLSNNDSFEKNLHIPIIDIIKSNKKLILDEKEKILEKKTYVEIKSAIKKYATKDFDKIQSLRAFNQQFFQLIERLSQTEDKKLTELEEGYVDFLSKMSFQEIKL